VASKGAFIATLKRLDYQCAEVERAAFAQHAAEQWQALSAQQRSELARDDFRSRIFAAGYAAGQAAAGNGQMRQFDAFAKG
jgi:hypothetical protein